MKIMEGEKRKDVQEFEKKLKKFAMSKKLEGKELDEKDLKYIFAEYDENHELNEKNHYFDSQNDQGRLEAYYLEKYQINLRKNISYSLMIIFCIVAVIYNTQSPWNYSFRQIVENKLRFSKQEISLIGN